MEHRFMLEKYRWGSKLECPECHKPKSFVRYIDTAGKIKFPYYVGRCDREDKCGYHYKPKDYFREHPDNNELTGFSKRGNPIVQTKSRLTSYINESVLRATITCYQNNHLYLYLCKVFGAKDTSILFERYKVGTSKHWSGSTLFWQVDCENKIRTGKVMLYNSEDGHRVKDDYSKIAWVHRLLKLNEFNLKQCFFGEHLLSLHPYSPVGIVESEKTAIIAAYYMPEYTWLATGGKNGCFNTDAVKALKDREVMLMPDLGATEEWRQKTGMLKPFCKRVELCNVLEEIATEEQRNSGWDFADFLLEENSRQNMLRRMIHKNSALQKLIEAFDLKLIDAGY